MQPINAISLTPTVGYWLENSRHPRILHVFDYVCNLINERREVLSIVIPQIGNGPFNLVLEDDILFSEYLKAESPISILGNQLTLGNLIVNIKGEKLWNPRPDWETLYARRDVVLNSIMSLRGAPFATKQSARRGGDCFGRTNAALATTLPITNYQFSNLLITSLINADLASTLIAIQKLAGLGQGLTPAGDDFILGAVLAAWIIHPVEIASALAQEIVNTSAPLTTSLSGAWLKSAGRGEAGVLWHNFFDALTSGDSSAVELEVSKILSIGETSGADAFAGFIGTFISYAEMEKNHVIPKHIQ